MFFNIYNELNTYNQKYYRLHHEFKPHFVKIKSEKILLDLLGEFKISCFIDYINIYFLNSLKTHKYFMNTRHISINNVDMLQQLDTD